MIQIYHNNRCSKSRSAVCVLEESGKPFETINYLQQTPTTADLKSILKKLGIKPQDLIRVGETIYKENYKGKNLSDDEWVAVMVENPILIERPIIINGDKAVIGRPAEKVLEIL